MSIIDQIASLMLEEGRIKGQEGRERIAMEEEQRQAKHRTLKNILKFAAQIGPYFIPGAGIVPALGHGAKIAKVAAPLISAGTHASGLGYNQFAGPMTHNDWYQTPWDEEGVG